jgi:hypothetical protein
VIPAPLICWMRGHEYAIWQAFTPRSRRVYCERCQKDWGMNDDVRAFIPWDSEIEQMYATMGYTVRPRRVDRSKA